MTVQYEGGGKYNIWIMDKNFTLTEEDIYKIQNYNFSTCKFTNTIEELEDIISTVETNIDDLKDYNDEVLDKLNDLQEENDNLKDYIKLLKEKYE